MRVANCALATALAMLGCGTVGAVSPALSAATPAPAPYTGSIFARCTVLVSDSGQPGRWLQRQELQPSGELIGACPRVLVTTSTSNTQVAAAQSTDRHVYYLTDYVAPGTCFYATPPIAATNSIKCELAQPTPWPDAQPR
jgi:hypothetical protein